MVSELLLSNFSHVIHSMFSFHTLFFAHFCSSYILTVYRHFARTHNQQALKICWRNYEKKKRKNLEKQRKHSFQSIKHAICIKRMRKKYVHFYILGHTYYRMQSNTLCFFFQKMIFLSFNCSFAGFKKTNRLKFVSKISPVINWLSNQKQVFFRLECTAHTHT